MIYLSKTAMFHSYVEFPKGSRFAATRCPCGPCGLKSWVFMGNVVNLTLNHPEYLGVVVKNTLVGGFNPSEKYESQLG